MYGQGYAPRYDRQLGFQSRFDGLDAIVYSQDFVYQNKGAVQDVHEAGLETYIKMHGESKGKRLYDEHGGGKNALGMMTAGQMTTTTRNGSVIYASSFYEPQKSKMLEKAVDYHEQVHGLHAGKNITDAKTLKQYRYGISLLEEQMQADGYDTSELAKRRDFYKMRGEKGVQEKEFVANFGMFYLMEKNGYSADALWQRHMRFNTAAPQLKEAFAAFKKAQGKQAVPSLAQSRPSLEDRLAGAPVAQQTTVIPKRRRKSSLLEELWQAFYSAYTRRQREGAYLRNYNRGSYAPSYA